MKSILLLCLTISFNTFAYRVYDTQNAKYINKSDFHEQIKLIDQFVLGEFHYDLEIQQTEADIIQDIVKERNLEKKFTIAWEFLNYPDQEKLDSSMTKYKNNLISSIDIIKEFFPGEKNTEMNKSYVPLFDVAKKLDGQFIATNAPREWKSVITKKDISELSKDKIPANMSEGSTDYFDRFENIMGGHVKKEMLKKYFTAQSYTDSVISTSINKLAENDLQFLVIGAFHSDFNDGVIPKLNSVSNKEAVTIKIINPKELDQSDIEQYLNGSELYGQYARYIILTK